MTKKALLSLVLAIAMMFAFVAFAETETCLLYTSKTTCQAGCTSCMLVSAGS